MELSAMSKRWRYALGFALCACAIIALLLPVVDEIEGIRGLPDWVRGVATILLLIVDFPSAFAMMFYVGFCWPECLPVFVWPDGGLESLFIVAVHAPSFLFWLGIGFLIGRLKQRKHSLINAQQEDEERG